MVLAADATRARGWYHGWNIIAVCVLLQMAANGLSVNSFTLFLHSWVVDLHTKISWLQLAMLPLSFTMAIVSPLVGVLADKYSARTLFGVGMVFLAAFCGGIGAVTKLWQLMALYAVLFPLAIGFTTTIIANALVSRWFVRRLGLALGLTAFGVGMGGVVLPPIVALGIPLVGWRGIWWIAAASIVFVIAPLIFLVVRDRPGPRDGDYYLTGGDAAAISHHVHGAGTGKGISWWGILKRRNFWVLMIAFIPILGIYAGGAYNLSPLIVSRGFSPQLAGLFASVLGIAHVASTLLLGFASDRFGNRLPFAGLAVVAACGAAVLSFAHSLIGLCAGFALIGAGGGLWTLLAAAIAIEFGADSFGRAFGLTMFLLPINSLSNFIVAKSQETLGSYAPGLLGYAIFALVGGTICLSFLRERHVGHLSANEKLAMEEGASPVL